MPPPIIAGAYSSGVNGTVSILLRYVNSNLLNAQCVHTNEHVTIQSYIFLFPI